MDQLQFLKMVEVSEHNEVAVVREVYEGENSHDDFEKQLDRLLEAGVPVIVIEPGRLGDETQRWIAVGRGLHLTSVCSGVGAFLAGCVWSDRPVLCCPLGTLSLLSAGLYTLSWHFDPCCHYQVERDVSALAAISRRCPRVSTSVVLVRRSSLRSQRHAVHWTMALAATALCLFRLYNVLS